MTHLRRWSQKSFFVKLPCWLLLLLLFLIPPENHYYFLVSRLILVDSHLLIFLFSIISYLLHYQSSSCTLFCSKTEITILHPKTLTPQPTPPSSRKIKLKSYKNYMDMNLRKRLVKNLSSQLIPFFPDLISDSYDT